MRGEFFAAQTRIPSQPAQAARSETCRAGTGNGAWGSGDTIRNHRRALGGAAVAGEEWSVFDRHLQVAFVIGAHDLHDLLPDIRRQPVPPGDELR